MSREKYASKVTWFPETSEGTYGDPVKLPWCVKLTTKDNYITGEIKGDGRIEESTSVLESSDIGLELSSALPLEKLCKLTGEEYIKGMSITTTKTQPVKGCLAYEIDMGGNVRRRALRNCYLTKSEQNNETESEGEVFKFEGKAIGDDNNDVYFTLDKEEVAKGADTKVQAVFDTFFEKCPARPVIV